MTVASDELIDLVHLIYKWRHRSSRHRTTIVLADRLGLPVGLTLQTLKSAVRRGLLSGLLDGDWNTCAWEIRDEEALVAWLERQRLMGSA